MRDLTRRTALAGLAAVIASTALGAAIVPVVDDTPVTPEMVLYAIYALDDGQKLKFAAALRTQGGPSQAFFDMLADAVERLVADTQRGRA